MRSSRSCRSIRPGRSRSPRRAASRRCRDSSSVGPPLTSSATSRSWRSCPPATRTRGSGCSRKSWPLLLPAAGCRRREPGSRATSSSAPTPTTRSADWRTWRRCGLAIHVSCRNYGRWLPTVTPILISDGRRCRRLSVPATKGFRQCSRGSSTIPRFRRRRSTASPPFPATARLPRSWPPTKACRRSVGRRRSLRSHHGLRGRLRCSTRSLPTPCPAATSRRSPSAGSPSRPTRRCSRGSTRSGARSE